jgi:hypothetical protein
MNPLMLTATSVLRSLQRISKCDLPSLEDKRRRDGDQPSRPTFCFSCFSK